MAGVVRGEEQWPFGPLKRWLEGLANSPYGSLSLFLVAFVEAIFFPIPPDLVLIVLGVTAPRRSLFYASVCLVGSVLGGVFGFLLGREFWHWVGPIVLTYVTQEGFELVREYFQRYEAWAIGIAGFTPIPYKVFTLSAGFFRVDFTIFLIASALSRGARFFLVGGLIYGFGPPIKIYVDRYFNLFTVGLVVLLIGGYLALRFLF